MALNIDLMKIDELKDVIKMLIRMSNNQHDLIRKLQHRLLELENKVYRNKNSNNDSDIDSCV